MKTKVKMRLASIVLSMAMVIGMIASPCVNTQKAQAEVVAVMGQWYVAKGLPMTFQDKKAKKIKVVSAAGNKYKVSKNKITITCKNGGTIIYKANGKTKKFYIIIGGNGKDTKVKKSEYISSNVGVNNKKYKNFIDAADAYMGKKKSDAYVEFMKKERINDEAKHNRGVKYGTSFKTLKKKYPSWQDVGTYGNDECCYAALYYDKKTGIIAEKGFILNKNYKVKGVVLLAYRAAKIRYQLEEISSSNTDENDVKDDENTSYDKNNSEDDSKKEDTNTSDEIKREDARFYLNLANPIILDGNENVYFLSCADCKYIDGKYKVDTVYMISGGDPFFEKGLKTTEEFDKHYNVTEGEWLKELVSDAFNNYQEDIMYYAHEGKKNGNTCYDLGLQVKNNGSDDSYLVPSPYVALPIGDSISGNAKTKRRVFYIDSNVSVSFNNREYEYKLGAVECSVTDGEYVVDKIYMTSEQDLVFYDDDWKFSYIEGEDFDHYYNRTVGKEYKEYMTEMFKNYLPEILKYTKTETNTASNGDEYEVNYLKIQLDRSDGNDKYIPVTGN